jgi:hypothetical protein
MVYGVLRPICPSQRFPCSVTLLLSTRLLLPTYHASVLFGSLFMIDHFSDLLPPFFMIHVVSQWSYKKKVCMGQAKGSATYSAYRSSGYKDTTAHLLLGSEGTATSEVGGIFLDQVLEPPSGGSSRRRGPRQSTLTLI